MSDVPGRGPGAPVRTYRKRRRMTEARWASLATNGRYLIDPDGLDGAPVDLDLVFGRSAPRVLDIGFGHGESTLALAADTDTDVLAVDVHTPGVADLLDRMAATGTTNVRVAEADVVPLLDRFGHGSFIRIQVLFPDPWPKTRHSGRRLVREPFVTLAADLLSTGGLLHVVTDSGSYAATASAAIASEARLERCGEGPGPRPVTRFEARAVRAGRPVHELLARRR